MEGKTERWKRRLREEGEDKENKGKTERLRVRQRKDGEGREG
jgi:hypothetical protein